MFSKVKFLLLITKFKFLTKLKTNLNFLFFSQFIFDLKKKKKRLHNQPQT